MQVVLVDQRLEEFPTELFSGMLKMPLAQIRLLDLRSNRVPVLPARIAQMRHLTCLRLTGNCLSTLPPELAQLSRLQELQLGDNTLERVPEVVSQLSELRTLGLAGNALTSLPDSLAHLRSLTSLDVARNHLETLPAQALGALVKLVTLDVSDNLLTALPASIGLCYELREVRASVCSPLASSADSIHPPPSSPSPPPPCESRGRTALGIHSFGQAGTDVVSPVGVVCGGSSHLDIARGTSRAHVLTLVSENLIVLLSGCGCMQVRATNNALVYVPHELGRLPQLVRFSMAGCPASVVMEGSARAPLPTIDAAKLVLRGDDESVGTLDGAPVCIYPRARAPLGRVS